MRLFSICLLRRVRGLCVFFLQMICAAMLAAQFVPTNDPPQYGPYNASFLAGGDGLRVIVDEKDTVLRADSPWTISCWVKFDEPVKAPTLVAGLGETSEEYPRYLSVDANGVTLWMGKDNTLSGKAALPPGKWIFLATEFDGKEFRLYSDGVAVTSGTLAVSATLCSGVVNVSVPFTGVPAPYEEPTCCPFAYRYAW